MDKNGATREELAIKQSGGKNMKSGMLDGDLENGYQLSWSRDSFIKRN